MRDWSRGQALGYYSIRPSQFNTRKPLHIQDEDLCQTSSKVDVPGQIIERPRTEFTRLSYTVYALELAILARESMDLRGPLHQINRKEASVEEAKIQALLNTKYERFVAGLPSYFRLGSTAGLTATSGPMAAIPVHRWMLHQQLWSLFLKIHRSSLSSQDGRTSCQLLAQNIITNQAQIQARCAVCGSLSTNKTQLFNAAAVLLIDLLFSSQSTETDRSSAQLNRLMTRERVREAIGLFRTQDNTEWKTSPQGSESERVTPPALLSSTVLEALMQLEEEEFGNIEGITDANSTEIHPGEQEPEFNNSTRKSLKNRIMNILQTIQAKFEGSAAVTEHPNIDSLSALTTPEPSLATTGGAQELDVLPVLYNDPNYNLWQFLDFSPPPLSPTNNYL